jgi:hypothetical protein
MADNDKQQDNTSGTAGPGVAGTTHSTTGGNLVPDIPEEETERGGSSAGQSSSRINENDDSSDRAPSGAK